MSLFVFFAKLPFQRLGSETLSVYELDGTTLSIMGTRSYDMIVSDSFSLVLQYLPIAVKNQNYDLFCKKLDLLLG